MRKRSGQVHSRESSATLQLTVSLLYPFSDYMLIKREELDIIKSECVRIPLNILDRI